MKKSKRDGFPKGELFAKVPYALMDSAAWQTLNPRAVWVYLRLLRGWNGGNYSLPVNSARGICNHNTIRTGLDDLMEAGLIERIGPPGGLTRTADKYRLSEKWRVRSKALELDAAAGVQQSRLQKDGTKFYLWIPTKAARTESAAIENLKRGRSKVQKKLPNLKKTRPGE
jgi:predicted transcriptional regulator